MNLNLQERTLIKDVFNLRVVYEPNQSDSSILLKNFPQEIATLGNNFSLLENTSYFDSLLMERLQLPETDTLDYLEVSLAKCFNNIDKPWNQSNLAQNFIKYSIQIIKNFIYLTQTTPELFPEQLQIDPEAEKTADVVLALSMRLLTHFERRGYNQEIMNVFYPKINEQYGNLPQSFIEVLIARQRFMTILDGKAFFYLNILECILPIPEFKEKFVNLNNSKFSPEMALKMQGSVIDKKSPLGLFMRLSVLGASPDYYFQEKSALEKFEGKMMDQFGTENINRTRIKFYADLQNEFYEKFTAIFKILFKKDSQKPFFEWIYSSIMSNLSRAKLATRLAGYRNDNISHDGFMVNLYVCMLNLCKPLFNKESGKYKNIDPEYFVFNRRTELCKYQPLNSRQKPSLQSIQKDFGTITEFFFLTFELLHMGYLPSQDNFTQIIDRKEKLEKLLRDGNHPAFVQAKIKKQIGQVRSKSVRYYLITLDEKLISTSKKLFSLMLDLLPDWLQFDYDMLNNCRFPPKYKLPSLAHFLPEHFLDSICKFHFNNFKYKPSYIQLIGEQHIHELINVTCLLLSQAQITSNPYLGANFVELIFFFLLENKTGMMSEVFRTNAVAHRNMTLALIKFYCDIAVTGSSHQFYSKFRYRSYVNKIFTSLWNHAVYRNNIQSYFKTEVFQRFLNMAMGDTTYCFDQTKQKYENFKELENKRSAGIFSQEDQANQEQLSSQISATLQHSTSNLKLLKQLSNWSPETFFSEAFLGDIVLLLNNILQTFVEPTSFVANRQLLFKYKFEKEIVLSDLVQIYVNLDISEKFASEIVKDTRFFKKENFSKALQKASNQHQTDISTLEKFEDLIGKLQTAINEEEDEEEIYGEIPEKYLCSLMITLMKDPVELPSGYIVDRVYIYKQLLNDERDPFTRAPLKNGEWKELKQLKDEIEVWKKKRMEELKGANKEVKYGKIGLNKKEEEEEDILYGGKMKQYQKDDDN